MIGSISRLEFNNHPPNHPPGAGGGFKSRKPNLNPTKSSPLISGSSTAADRTRYNLRRPAQQRRRADNPPFRRFTTDLVCRHSFWTTFLSDDFDIVYQDEIIKNIL